jgi:hypothetical protein
MNPHRNSPTTHRHNHPRRGRFPGRITGVIATCLGAAALSSCAVLVPAVTEPSADSSSPSETSTTVVDTTASDGLAALSASSPDSALLSVSIHLEGWRGEGTNEAMFERHRDEIEAVADQFAAHGAKLTLEVTDDFATGIINFDPGFVARMQALGHSFGLHADVGGTAITLEAFIAELTSLKALLAQAGIEAVHVSGICSEAPWVEAAIAAGFSATVGAVEYCLLTLPAEDIPAGHESVLSCERPDQCHSNPIDGESRMYPWYTSSSSSWLTPDADGDLLIVVGEGGHPIPCLDGEATASCTGSDADTTILLETLDQYVAAAAASEATPLASFSWSIGARPDNDWVERMLTAIDAYVETGTIEWTTVDALVG